MAHLNVIPPDFKEIIKNEISQTTQKRKERRALSFTAASTCNRKKIAQLNPIDGSLIAVHNSITDALQHIPPHYAKWGSQISAVCNKKKDKAYGFKWAYYDDYISSTKPAKK